MLRGLGIYALFCIDLSPHTHKLSNCKFCWSYWEMLTIFFSCLLTGNEKASTTRVPHIGSLNLYQVSEQLWCRRAATIFIFDGFYRKHEKKASPWWHLQSAAVYNSKIFNLLWYNKEKSTKRSHLRNWNPIIFWAFLLYCWLNQLFDYQSFCWWIFSWWMMYLVN